MPADTSIGSINPVDELRQETKLVEQSLAAKQDDRGDEAELAVVKMTSTEATHNR